MTEMHCVVCGKLTAKLEKGSSKSPQAVMLCGKCYSGVGSNNKPIADIFGDVSKNMFKGDDMDTVNMFKNIFGMK